MKKQSSVHDETEKLDNQWPIKLSLMSTNLQKLQTLDQQISSPVSLSPRPPSPHSVLSHDDSSVSDIYRMAHESVTLDFLPKRFDRGLQPDYIVQALVLLQLGVDILIVVIFFTSIPTGNGVTWFHWLQFSLMLVLLFFALFWLNYKLFNVIFAVYRLFMDFNILKQNDKYFSGCEIPDFFVYSKDYPNITIQIPVYKEDLHDTIKPTLLHCLREAKRYEGETGSQCNVIICDDGMNVIPEATKQQRIEFYKQAGVSFTARPHPSKLVRKGRFKKAGNLNFSMNLSALVRKVENQLVGIEEGNQANTDSNKNLKQRLDDLTKVGTVYSGDINYGEFILLIDSDTRLPNQPREENGCIKRLVKEMMFDGQDVLFIQCFTGPYLSVKSVAEKGIFHHTCCIYNSILTTTAHHMMAPLVGHNCLINVKAMEECATMEGSEDYLLYWAEDRISEDFDLMMRGCDKGYIGRYASYAGTFLEGVSFSYTTEYFKVSKFACGAAEMVFNPLNQWRTKGLISQDLVGFLKSENIEWYNKLIILSYILNFIAIALAHWGLLYNLIFCDLLYQVMPFVLLPTNLMFESIFIWAIVGTTVNFAFGVRMGFNKWLYLKQCLREAALLTCLYGSISPKMSIMYMAHLFNWNISFGATKKSDDRVTLLDWVRSAPMETLIYTLYIGLIVIRLLYFTSPDQINFVIFYGCTPLMWSIFLFWVGPFAFDILPKRTNKQSQPSYVEKEKMFLDKYNSQIPISKDIKEIQVGSNFKMGLKSQDQSTVGTSVGGSSRTGDGDMNKPFVQLTQRQYLNNYDSSKGFATVGNSRSNQQNNSFKTLPVDKPDFAQTTSVSLPTPIGVSFTAPANLAKSINLNHRASIHESHTSGTLPKPLLSPSSLTDSIQLAKVSSTGRDIVTSPPKEISFQRLYMNNQRNAIGSNGEDSLYIEETVSNGFVEDDDSVASSNKSKSSPRVLPVAVTPFQAPKVYVEYAGARVRQDSHASSSSVGLFGSRKDSDATSYSHVPFSDSRRRNDSSGTVGSFTSDITLGTAFEGANKTKVTTGVRTYTVTDFRTRTKSKESINSDFEMKHRDSTSSSTAELDYDPRSFNHESNLELPYEYLERSRAKSGSWRFNLGRIASPTFSPGIETQRNAPVPIRKDSQASEGTFNTDSTIDIPDNGNVPRVRASSWRIDMRALSPTVFNSSGDIRRHEPPRKDSQISLVSGNSLELQAGRGRELSSETNSTWQFGMSTTADSPMTIPVATRKDSHGSEHTFSTESTVDIPADGVARPRARAGSWQFGIRTLSPFAYSTGSETPRNVSGRKDSQVSLRTDVSFDSRLGSIWRFGLGSAESPATLPAPVRKDSEASEGTYNTESTVNIPYNGNINRARTGSWRLGLRALSPTAFSAGSDTPRHFPGRKDSQISLISDSTIEYSESRFGLSPVESPVTVSPSIRKDSQISMISENTDLPTQGHNRKMPQENSRDLGLNALKISGIPDRQKERYSTDGSDFYDGSTLDSSMKASISAAAGTTSQKQRKPQQLQNKSGSWFGLKSPYNDRNRSSTNESLQSDSSLEILYHNSQGKLQSPENATGTDLRRGFGTFLADKSTKQIVKSGDMGDQYESTYLTNTGVILPYENSGRIHSRGSFSFSPSNPDDLPKSAAFSPPTSPILENTSLTQFDSRAKRAHKSNIINKPDISTSVTARILNSSNITQLANSPMSPHGNSDGGNLESQASLIVSANNGGSTMMSSRVGPLSSAGVRSRSTSLRGHLSPTLNHHSSRTSNNGSSS